MTPRFLAKVKRIDKISRWLITFGGISIIGSMLIMIVFMIRVTLPLFSSPEHRLAARFDLDSGQPIHFGAGPYLERGFAVDAKGGIAIFELKNGNIVDRVEIMIPEDRAGITLLHAEKQDRDTHALYWSDGSMSLEHIGFEPVFDENNVRSIHLKHKTLAFQGPEPGLAPDAPALIRGTGENGESIVTLVRLMPNNRILYRQITGTADFLGERSEKTRERYLEPGVHEALTAIALSRNGSRLYAGTATGRLIGWNLDTPKNPVRAGPVIVSPSRRPIMEVQLLFGEVSLVVSDTTGDLTAWQFLTLGGAQLTRLHDLPDHRAPVRQIVPSFKNKTFASLDRSGEIALTFLTTEKLLVRIAAAEQITRIDLAERGDGLLARDETGAFWFWRLEIPHPEVSPRTLWGKVRYEGYPAPDHVWQSSSASDDFEPKLSLVPLLFGSLKGTFYGMLFSFPLALLAAIYVSHLMNPRWRTLIKPVIELMSAVPTVVIGFLAALWLAPRLEGNLFAVVLGMIIIPVSIMIGMFFVLKSRTKTTGREFLWGLPLAILGAYLAYRLGLVFEDNWFGGNMNLWLFRNLGWTIDQRNCVVISFALGFAVIPIIFTISEDALYNVPRHMTAAAFALGSTRWQTVRRVVLPMAGPGIFAATMIGFGRAVGETMIVLMATGNTPIMSPSILNGMRTLSANIAVEIPEAPLGSTLYRVLFLSAIMLFAITFLVNTLAEVVRVRLRKKYKHL